MKLLRYLCLLVSITLIQLHGTNAQHYKKTFEELERRGEVYIKFQKQKETDLQSMSDIVSIDKFDFSEGKNDIYAYLNKNQFDLFVSANVEFELLSAPSMLAAITMCPDLNSVRNWNCYPTYSQYVSLMESFVTNYPDLCKLEEFGQSINGKKLLVLKISDNAANKEDEPEFLYTSTMHGDEVVGYVLMLRLIDYLLSNYATDTRISNLVDNTEIWINPNSNPDGTYAAGDNTLAGATRGNADYYDLNRNFPDPWFGDHPYGAPWQKETLAMIAFLKKHNFVLAANFHGGEEVVNYPWDNWTSAQKLHADDLWYQEISHQYADTAHVNSIYYMDSLSGTPNPSGITNGGDWYTVKGGRQDYMNYFMHSREVTIEISETKLPDPSSLPMFWNYNYRSFLNYINRVHTGISGKITDQFGNPVEANVSLTGHDFENSVIYSDSITGMYYRMLSDGNYHLLASAYGYTSAEFDLSVISGSPTHQDIVLQKWPEGIEETGIVQYISNPFKEFIEIKMEMRIPGKIEIKLIDLLGRVAFIHYQDGKQGSNVFTIMPQGLKKGIYVCRISSEQSIIKTKLLKSSDN
jgi:hypothetical protein